MRINKTAKKEFVTKLERKIYAKKIEKSGEKVKRLGESLYQALFDKSVQKTMTAMPESIIPRHKGISANIVIDGYMDRLYLEFASKRPLPDAFYGINTHWGFLTINFKLKGEDKWANIHKDAADVRARLLNFDKIAEPIIKEHSALIIEAKKFEEDLRAAIEPISTLKQLQSLDDTLAAEFTKLMSDEVKTKPPVIVPQGVIDVIKASREEVTV